MSQADEPKKKSKKADAGASVSAPAGSSAQGGTGAGVPVSQGKPERKSKASKAPVDGGGAKAVARYVRMAPRKLRLVLDAIRGKSVTEARGILQFCGKRAAGPLAKVLNSAVANAENNLSMNSQNLFIATGFVDQGPCAKSFIPRSRGRASAIHKFMSHITIVVKEREGR